MSKKLFLALVPFLVFGMSACQRGNGGTSSGGTSGKDSGTSSQSSQASGSSAVDSSGEESSADESSGEESSSEETTGVTYTVTTTQEWVFTDNVPIFAHYWDGVNPGEWATVVYENNSTTGTFVIPENVEAVGFLLVRCAEGTALEEGKYPNWEITSGDDPGRIYNKTGSNVDIVEGTTEYALPNMVDYPTA